MKGPDGVAVEDKMRSYAGSTEGTHVGGGGGRGREKQGVVGGGRLRVRMLWQWRTNCEAMRPQRKQPLQGEGVAGAAKTTTLWLDRKSTRLNSSHVSESRMP